MEPRAAFILAFLAGAALAGCLQPPGPDLAGARDAALAHLANLPPGSLAPYVLEAAVASGLDANAWPPAHPVADHVQLPANGTYQSLLRPAFALSRLHGLPDRDAIYNRVSKGYDGRQFGDGALQNDDIFALWTLSAMVPDWAIEPWSMWGDSLLANQTAAGGWSWATNGTADTDSTGMALSALVSMPGSNATAHLALRAHAALAYLASTRVVGGGFASQPGGQANCDSTVWGLRGEDLLGAPGNATAWHFLLGLRRGDGGFAYLPADGSSNDLCTAEVATLLGDAVAGRVTVPHL